MPENTTRKTESPDKFVLTIAEDKETKDYTRGRNAETWMNLLSREDYVRREAILELSKMATAGDNKLVVFTLAAVDDPTIPLCSCEVMVRQAWRYGLSEDKKVTRTNLSSGCIGGVYSYPENRGRGLATIMIDKVVDLMKRPEHLGPEGFIFLYSEVGEFYARNGFKSFPVPLLHLPLATSEKKFEQRAGTELVEYRQFEDLVQAYSKQFDESMRQKVLADGLERVSIVPTADIIDWFHLRIKYFGTKLFGETKEQLNPETHALEAMDKIAQLVDPLHFGIKLTCQDTGNHKGFIVWQYNYDKDKKTGELENYAIVIKIHVDTAHFDEAQVTHELIATMKEYLEADHGIPQLSNFYKIEIWESEISQPIIDELVQEYNCKTGGKNSSRSAILYNNAEDDEKIRSGKLLWENNTKLPWF